MSNSYLWDVDRHDALNGVLNGEALRHTARRFARFLVVGLAGLAADAGLMTLLHAAGLSLPVSRAGSMAVAFSVTWLLNRRVTFAATGSSPQGEFLRYAAVSLIAQGASYAIFCALISALPQLPALAALLAGAVLAAFLSFAGCSFIVFPAPHGGECRDGMTP